MFPFYKNVFYKSFYVVKYLTVSFFISITGGVFLYFVSWKNHYINSFYSA